MSLLRFPTKPSDDEEVVEFSPVQVSSYTLRRYPLGPYLTLRKFTHLEDIATLPEETQEGMFKDLLGGDTYLELEFSTRIPFTPIALTVQEHFPKEQLSIPLLHEADFLHYDFATYDRLQEKHPQSPLVYAVDVLRDAYDDPLKINSVLTNDDALDMNLVVNPGMAWYEATGEGMLYRIKDSEVDTELDTLSPYIVSVFSQRVEFFRPFYQFAAAEPNPQEIKLLEKLIPAFLLL